MGVVWMNRVTLMASGIAILLGGYAIFPSNYRYRYKMIVAVDTPKGVKRGYAVLETLVSKSNINLGEFNPKRTIETKGEAVAVDLPGGQTLFALIPEDTLAQATLDPEWENDWVESAKRIRAGLTPGELVVMKPGVPERFAKPNGYPKLVRFRDLRDPRSLELVDPNNLSASFGSGVRLQLITLQVTDEKMTSVIDKKIEWIDHLDRYRQNNGNTFTDNFPREIADLRKL
jgi:hypothetical protein